MQQIYLEEQTHQLVLQGAVSLVMPQHSQNNNPQGYLEVVVQLLLQVLNSQDYLHLSKVPLLLELVDNKALRELEEGCLGLNQLNKSQQEAYSPLHLPPIPQVRVVSLVELEVLRSQLVVDYSEELSQHKFSLQALVFSAGLLRHLRQWQGVASLVLSLLSLLKGVVCSEAVEVPSARWAQHNQQQQSSSQALFSVAKLPLLTKVNK